MTEDINKKFVDEYKKFYQMFFDCISESVSFLADVQEKYKEQYQQILDFNENPMSLDELIEKIPIKQQAILLRVLLKAGEFGKKFANLMEMNPKEKRDFANDLKKFAADIDKL